jgi:hypothetical protein
MLSALDISMESNLNTPAAPAPATSTPATAALATVAPSQSRSSRTAPSTSSHGTATPAKTTPTHSKSSRTMPEVQPIRCVLCCGCAERDQHCQHRIIAFCDKCNEEHICNDKHNCSESTKGQLISKCPFGAIKLTKNTTEIFVRISALAS